MQCKIQSAIAQGNLMVNLERNISLKTYEGGYILMLYKYLKECLS